VVLQGNRVDAGSADVAVVLHPASLTQLLPAVDAWLGLTPREAQVLRLVANGLPGKHIATRLDISPQTVNTHLRSIYRKAHVTGRAELLAQLT
jgi:DNA-binding CsgD family transcriptional regulator